MIDTVTILKLVNDKEIIGKYSIEDDYSVFLKDPLEVQTIYDVHSGIARCILGGYMTFANAADVGIGFPKIHILHFLPVKPSIEQYYINSINYINSNKIDKFEEMSSMQLDNITDSQYIYKNISKSIH